MEEKLFNLLKESAYKQLDAQLSSIESLENKTGILLGLIFGTPTILITLLTIGGFVPQWNTFLIVSSVSLALAVICSVKSLLCKNFSLPAGIEKFLAENEGLEITKTRPNFIDDCRKAIKGNAGKLKTKGDYFNRSLVLFIISIVFCVFGIIEGRWFNMPANESNQETTPAPVNQTDVDRPTQPAEGDEGPRDATPSGLPEDRQDTTMDIFKGAEEYSTNP